MTDVSAALDVQPGERVLDVAPGDLVDAQSLPFDDDSFDVVMMSTFGVTFGSDQQRVADELLRVCRPGGRLGLVNWGREAHVRALFGDRISSLRLQPRALEAPIIAVKA